MMEKNNASALPFSRSYWVVPGKLLAGAYPGSPDSKKMTSNLKGLVACGMRLVVNLMEENETDHFGRPFSAYEEELKKIGEAGGLNISCPRFPIADVNVPSRELMRSILNEIDRSLDRDLPVYVHCWGGRGRTGTVIGCYLVRHGLTGTEALKRIEDLRKYEPTGRLPSPETIRQQKMVRTWKE
ncbi:MAG: protein phosphatase [Syntrophobacteraceae bacterium]